MKNKLDSLFFNRQFESEPGICQERSREFEILGAVSSQQAALTWRIRLKNKLDSLFFNRQFVPERHKYAMMADANLRFASPRRVNAPEWMIRLKNKIILDNRTALISVIVPVYNGEAYLEACIESIREQTYPNLEIIIINDGSTDRTGGICAKLQETSDNVKILTLQDEGVSAARNAGIEAANGDFLTFVDADDRLKPQMLQILYACILSTNSDIAGCQFLIWRSEEEWKDAVREKTEFSTASPMIYHADDYVRDAILQGNSRCWSKLYRKSAIGKTRFRTGLSIGEDMLFLMDLLGSVGKIAEMEYPGYGYFQNPNGAINRKFTPDYIDQITCWEIARNRIETMALEKDLYVQATAILMMGIMLTVGKLAMLSAAERRGQKKYIRLCHDKLKEAMRIEGAYRRLSGGYKIKTKLFYYLPGLYLVLYHLKKPAV